MHICIKCKKKPSSILSGHGSIGHNFSTWEAEKQEDWQELEASLCCRVSTHLVCQGYTERPSLKKLQKKTLAFRHQHFKSALRTHSLQSGKSNTLPRDFLLHNKWDGDKPVCQFTGEEREKPNTFKHQASKPSQKIFLLDTLLLFKWEQYTFGQ